MGQQNRNPNLIIRMEINLFFQNNPLTLETALGLSQCLERELPIIQQELDKLVEIKILQRVGHGKKSYYFYLRPQFISHEAWLILLRR